jgi:NADPH:quinone reductase
MRAVRYHEHGGEDVLQVAELPIPEPGDGELLVRVEATSVNPVDTYFREGTYPTPDLPWIPGSDVAGVVEETGPNVDFDEGDRVFATGLGKEQPGTCAEYAVVPTELAAPLPDSVPFERAAAGALVGVTAWQALVAAGGLEPGERALVHGGSGGVGHVAVQLATAMGADVTTTASPRYHERLTEIGAADVFDYASDDLADDVSSAGAPDVILDHRLDEYLGFDCRVAAAGGRIAAIGNDELEATFPHVPLARSKTISVYHVGMFDTPDISFVLHRLVRLFEREDVVPVVAERYDFEEIRDAHRAVLEESFFGKLVVVP